MTFSDEGLTELHSSFVLLVHALSISTVLGVAQRIILILRGLLQIFKRVFRHRDQFTLFNPKEDQRLDWLEPTEAEAAIVVSKQTFFDVLVGSLGRFGSLRRAHPIVTIHTSELIVAVIFKD